jgi:hypothetical protein
MFSRNGVIKGNGKPTIRTMRWWLPVLDTLLILALLFGGLYLVTISKILFALVLFTMGIYRIVNIILNRIRLNISEIERKAILRINMKPGIKGISRARARIVFRTNNGKKRRKLFILPDALDSQQTDTKEACEILREEGLIT